jgi:intracellular multiplication protein IcmJ
MPDDNIVFIGERARTASRPLPDLLPLSLSPGGTGPLDDARDLDPAIRAQVLDRDDRTCRFCGFKAPKWQEVHHLDGNHANDVVANLATACTLCHAARHLDQVGKANGGVLVWIPELSQPELNHAIRSAWTAANWAAAIAGDRRQHRSATDLAARIGGEARHFIDALEARTRRAESLFGTSDPAVMGTVLGNLPEPLLARADRLLLGLRLLPLRPFPRKKGPADVSPLDSWFGAGGPYANLSPRTWFSIGRSWEAQQ